MSDENPLKIRIQGKDLSDLFPELPEVIKDAVKSKTELEEDIKRIVYNDIKGPQFNAVRLCMFPLKIQKNEKVIIKGKEVGFKEVEVYHEKVNKDSSTWCENHALCPVCMNGISDMLGKRCMFEVREVEQLTMELIQDLSIDIEADHTDRRLLGELVVYSVLEKRAISKLASTSLESTKVTIGKNTKTYEKIQNINLSTIEQMAKLKEKARTKLVATKADRIKLNKEKKRIAGDGTAKVVEKIREAESRIKTKKGIGLIPGIVEEKIPKEKIEIIEADFIEEKKEIPTSGEEQSFEDFKAMFGGG